ncbi:hypothetical protein KF728_09785 [Candidatus Obscuribacterales bacterium]|nr:hypothetical protein [Candidatus Obscuribacterales bacterium]
MPDARRLRVSNEYRLESDESMEAARSCLLPQMKGCFSIAQDDGQRRVILVFAMLPDELSIVSEEADSLRDFAESQSDKLDYPISLRCTHEPKGLLGKKEDYAQMDPLEAAIHRQLRLDRRMRTFGPSSLFTGYLWLS